MPIKDVSRATLFRQGFSGREQISGTVKNTGSPDNIPVRRRVCLFQQDTKRLAAEVWSNETTGVYTFSSIAAGRYFIVPFDHTGLYSPAAESDIVVPVPPPAP